MFVLHPDPYLLPDYKISPFQTTDIAFNNSLPNDKSIDTYFNNRFHEKQFTYTVTGRSALNMALQTCALQKEDVATILTTTGNYYVSGCVTTEIDKFCKWNREITSRTKVVVVIHEFGFPFENLSALKKLDIPIIEDCAYAFFSEDESNSIGRVGDFVVYSFPKMFPIQIGGLLVYSKTKQVPDEQWENSFVEAYIKNVLSYYIHQQGEIVQRRIVNYHWLARELSKLEFEPRFLLQTGVVPGAYMFRVQDDRIDLRDLKDYLLQHGIQCSVFYGENSFFVPVHQALKPDDLQYMARAIQSFIA